MKYELHYTTKERSKGELNKLPSCTVPNQALSIPELIKRYVSGQSLGGSKTPFFDDSPEDNLLGGRPFASFDLSEQHQILKKAKADYDETINRLRNNKTVDKPTDKVGESTETKSNEV